MMVLIIFVLVVTGGILYNIVFCLIFEKLDAKKFQHEKTTQQRGGG